jgi:hypothetical protein
LSDFDLTRLPEIRHWNESFDPPPGVDGFITARVSITQALVAMSLVFPDVIRIGDCIILKESFSQESFDHWMKELNYDTQAVERTMNHVHLWDYFDYGDEAEELGIESLASRMASGWASTAAARFSDRRYISEVTDEYGPTVVMHSEPLPDYQNGSKYE